MSSGEMLPKLDFTTFVLSVGSAVYIALGVVSPEPGQKPSINLDMARHNIDILELLHEKTRGNRSAEEEQLLNQILFEVRMKFVEAQKSVNLKA